MFIKPPSFRSIDVPPPARPPGLARRVLYRIGAHVVGLHRIDRVMDNVLATKGCPAQTALDSCQVDWSISPSDLDQIPREGPVLIVANHAFGGADGLVIDAALNTIRSDYLILTNEMLLMLGRLRDRYLAINAFEPDDPINKESVRKAFRHLRDGHVLITFPAGEVSHRTWKRWSITDPEWSQSAAAWATRTKATVVPVFFHGHNSWLFQMAGLIHPGLRTFMLARQLLNKKGQCLRVSIGRPIPPEQLAEFTDRETLTQYLRGRVYMLNGRRSEDSARVAPTPAASTSLIPPITTADRCADEVMSLAPRQRLVDSGNLSVYLAKSRQIPHVLQEIGRLREITFREVGEGTGNQVDLDRFDRYYRHLFVWNHETQEIVGAYRLGLTDEIIRSRGVRGLYTKTLFNFDERLLDSLGPAVELGRSFIRTEYQRNFKPLMLLWRGISRFICLKPKYRYFFGVVSISNEYAAASKRLMTDFVSSTRMVSDFESLISPRNRHHPKRVRHWDLEPFRIACTELEDVEELVRDIENGRQGVPILLKQYLKLNAKLITFFNVDREFSDVIDGLMLVDFLDVDRRMLNWYFGKDEAAEFLRYYGRDQDPSPPDDSPDEPTRDLTASA